MLCRVKLDKDKTELEKSRIKLAKDKTELEKMRLEVMLQAHLKSEDRARASSHDIRAITEANENRAAVAFHCIAGIKSDHIELFSPVFYCDNLVLARTDYCSVHLPSRLDQLIPLGLRAAPALGLLVSW
jgi:hypothetical protein